MQEGRTDRPFALIEQLYRFDEAAAHQLTSHYYDQKIGVERQTDVQDKDQIREKIDARVDISHKFFHRNIHDNTS